MKRTTRLALVLAVLLAGTSMAEPSITPNITAAIADPARPELDKFRDERRKPAQALAFAGVREGMKVLELIPGNGYFTRMLSKAVGPGGKVYTFPGGEPRTGMSAALAKDAKYGNIQMVTGSAAELTLPEPVDLVWTSQNYHDLRTQAAAVNKAVFAALKPNGVYLIIDHAAKTGAREESVALHRVDEELVKQEVLAAGFVLEESGDFLRNPKDDRARQIMERDLNRQTDQFVLRFRKPQ